MNLAEYIKTCRLAKNISATDLAKEFNLDTDAYLQLEEHADQLQMSQFMRIASFLSIRFIQNTYERPVPRDGTQSDHQSNIFISIPSVDDFHHNAALSAKEPIRVLPTDVPIQIVDDFYTDFNLPEIRAHNARVLICALTTDNEDYMLPEQRGDIIFYFNRLEVFLEAIYVMHIKPLDKTKN